MGKFDPFGGETSGSMADRRFGLELACRHRDERVEKVQFPLDEVDNRLHDFFELLFAIAA